ncbi:MAG: hypothetical protein ABIK93_06420 [candidate division WOR-3 bacterium]
MLQLLTIIFSPLIANEPQLIKHQTPLPYFTTRVLVTTKIENLGRICLLKLASNELENLKLWNCSIES